MQNKVRIDKWLYAIRFYKSRTLATEACDGSKVKINGQSIKASKLIAVNDTITVRKSSHTVTVKVIKLIEKRVNATIAQICYEDLTPVEEKNKKTLPSAFILNFGSRDRGEGRPTKKDRREIEQMNEERELWWQQWEDEL